MMHFDNNQNMIENHKEVDKKLLDMIEQAMKCAGDSAEHFKALMLYMDNTYDKTLIKNIYLDEMKHYKYFQDIYSRIAKSKAIATRPALPKIKPELRDNFYDGILNKMKEIEFDRKIYFSFLDTGIRDMLFEVLTDKQNHGLCLNLLYTKYS